MKTNDELKKLAKDVYEGKIFLANTDKAINCSFGIMLIFATFPPDTVALYEDFSKAGPRSMNGYPCFTSCSYLTKDDWNIFVTYFEQYKELVKGWE